MYYRNNKKGVTAVFLTIITGAMLSCIIIFIQLAASVASVSYCNNLFNLAGRSVLSEFDLELKQRYGIIAFYGDAGSIKKNINSYVCYTINDDRYIRIGDINVNLKEYCLMDSEIFEEEIINSVNYKNLIGIKKTSSKIATGKRTLRNSKIINSLPSKGMDDKPSVYELVSKLKSISGVSELWEYGSKEYIITIYMFSVFKSGMSEADSENSFFRNEIEYIIEGKKSDIANRNAVKNDILKLRTLLNSLYIYSNPKMMKETFALAETITPGPEAVITQTAIIAAWAATEAEIDIKELEEGFKVPVFKDISSWKTDINGKIILKNTTADDKGYDYEDYLKILSASLKKEIKLARMMDLIQINLQGTYRGDFYIRNYYCGFKFDTEVNGVKINYDEKY